MRRFRTRSILPRRRHKWQWIRQSANNASPNASLNSIDLLQIFRSHAGITINLPEMTLWRIRLKIAITITVTTAATSNDGVLVTSFVDSMNQAVVNQLTDPMDQHDLVYDFLAAYETLMQTNNNAVTKVILYKEFDLKSHRRFNNIDDTLWLQLASSGTAVITDYSYSTAILTKIGR